MSCIWTQAFLTCFSAYLRSDSQVFQCFLFLASQQHNKTPPEASMTIFNEPLREISCLHEYRMSVSQVHVLSHYLSSTPTGDASHCQSHQCQSRVRGTDLGAQHWSPTKETSEQQRPLFWWFASFNPTVDSLPSSWISIRRIISWEHHKSNCCHSSEPTLK